MQRADGAPALDERQKHDDDRRHFSFAGITSAHSKPSHGVQTVHRRARSPGTGLAEVRLLDAVRGPMASMRLTPAGRWREADLNRRHLDFQSSALPAELSRRDPRS